MVLPSLIFAEKPSVNQTSQVACAQHETCLVVIMQAKVSLVSNLEEVSLAQRLLVLRRVGHQVW
jgi:hypothetical protein